MSLRVQRQQQQGRAAAEGEVGQVWVLLMRWSGRWQNWKAERARVYPAQPGLQDAMSLPLACPNIVHMLGIVQATVWDTDLLMIVASECNPCVEAIVKLCSSDTAPSGL